jgi:hypothetical protein
MPVVAAEAVPATERAPATESCALLRGRAQTSSPWTYNVTAHTRLLMPSGTSNPQALGAGAAAR